ncbi:MAG: peptide chain release factor N(5)-glutamine methyltransferase, partial [Clostridia bacterium]
MTRAEALRDATAQLTAQGALDAALDAQWMMADVVGLPRLQLLLERAQPLTQAQWERYQGLLTRRLTGEPLQYVLGTQDFMGHSFCVDARVLIPRQDTETLCEAAIAR